MQQHQTEEAEPALQKPAAPGALSPTVQELLQTPVAERQEREQIRAHLKRLRKRNPLRNLFDADGNLLASSETPFPLLLRTLQSDNEDHWRRKIVAAWELRQLPLSTEQIEAATRTLCDEIDGKHLHQARRMMQRIGHVLFRPLWISIPFVFVYGLWFVYANEPKLNLHFILANLLAFIGICLVSGCALSIVLGVFFAPFSLSCDANRMWNVRLAAIRTLERFGLPSSAGTLARAACDAVYDVRETANRALISVLPTLTPDPYGQMGSDVVPNLCRILDNRRKEDNRVPVEDSVALAILAALEKVGDGRAVATVRRLAERGLGKRQAEAARILPMLQERQRQEQNHSLLLRGAAGPETPPEHLLRPAAEERSAPPEPLLRAASADAETLP